MCSRGLHDLKGSEHEDDILVLEMEHRGRFGIFCEVLDSGFIVLDPLVDGFSGVLVEARREQDEGSSRTRYVLELTSAGTGNRILHFTSGQKSLVRTLFAQAMAGEKHFFEAGTLHCPW